MSLDPAHPPASPPPAGGVWTALRQAVSFPALLGVLLVAGAFASTSWHGGSPGSKIVASDDTWWHLVTGRRILETHQWPTSDPYSFTAPGDPWMAYEWLGDVAMAQVERAAGWRGMAGLLIALAATLTLLLYYLAFLRSGNAKAAAVACVLLLPLTAAFFNLRPQLIGYILLLVTLICLERFRQGRRKALWILPGVFLLWVNTHGTFVLGFVVLGLYWASGLVDFRRGCVEAKRWMTAESRQLLMVILLSAAVLPLTPYGSRLAAYPLEISLFQPVNLGQVTEWYPLPLNMGPWAYAFVGLLVFFVLIQAFYAAMTYRLEEILLLGFAVYEGCLHVRFLFFFALIFAPLLAVVLGRSLPAYEPGKDKYALNAVLIALIVAALAGFYPSCQALRQAVDEQCPSAAAEFMRRHSSLASALVFNDNGWGGYLIWSGRKVFIDGREDVYEYAGVLEDYIRIINLDPTTPLLLRKYGIEACLIKRNTPLGSYLAALPGWKQVYQDKLSTIYVRQAQSGAGGVGAR